MKPDSGHWDLQRLAPSEAPELHRALEAAKQQLPDPQQLARLAQSLAQRGISVASSKPVATTTAPSAVKLKLLVGAGVIGPLAVALLFWNAAAPHATVSAAPPSSTAPPALASNPAGPAVEAPPAVAGASLDKPAAHPVAPPSDTAPALSPLPSSTAGDVPAASIASPLATTPEPTRSAPRVAPAPAASAASVRSPSAVGGTSAESTGASVAARPTEIALLRDARLALGNDPSEALALAEQHRVQFPRGAMVQERELIAISALARMGRHTAVLARATQFASDFPNSPYRKQVSALAQ